MKTYRIATIPGDGIGKEVIPAGQQVMEVLAKACGTSAFEFENFGWGGDYYREHGVMMPADGLDALRKALGIDKDTDTLATVTALVGKHAEATAELAKLKAQPSSTKARLLTVAKGEEVINAINATNEVTPKADDALKGEALALHQIKQIFRGERLAG